jgi:hypothetical protein
MATKFAPTPASNIRPGDHLLEPASDGSFTAYTVETVYVTVDKGSAKDRRPSKASVPRIRLGFADDKYRYAGSLEPLLVAFAPRVVFESLNNDEEA